MSPQPVPAPLSPPPIPMDRELPDEEIERHAPAGSAKWHPGMPSPNPGGRPKDTPGVVQFLRVNSMKCAERLLAIAMGDLDALNASIPRGKRYRKLRVIPLVDQRLALEAVLNRAWGKPVETLQTPDAAALYVVRAPAPAPSTEQWVQQHGPAPTLQ